MKNASFQMRIKTQRRIYFTPWLQSLLSLKSSNGKRNGRFTGINFQLNVNHPFSMVAYL
jgi:hypothetical protein